jgi:hypothetical protein
MVDYVIDLVMLLVILLPLFLKTNGRARAIQHNSVLSGSVYFSELVSGHDNLNQRDTSQRWQHSISTISRIVHEVAASILSIPAEFIRAPRADDVIHDHILNNPKFREFDGCDGALDGSHVPALTLTLNLTSP